jgi:transglutaminase-like putative cysteine protease
VPPDYLRASDAAWTASGADKAKTPFGAAFLLEHYLRSAPFSYDLTPKQKKGVPPLVDFLDRSHKGYCQMYSGAMALILRLHGIPARIAVGFTTGRPPKKSGDPYIVMDRNAHAWVEVFFPGYGWMPFEPTPTRTITEGYSSSSPTFRNIATGGGVKTLDSATLRIFNQVQRVGSPIDPAKNPQYQKLFKQGVGDHGHGGSAAAPVGAFAGTDSSHGRFLPWLFTAIVLVVIGIVVFKAVAARWRYLRRGPRARATAAYHDLATFVGDQGVAVRPGFTFEDLAGQVEHTFGVPATGFARAASRARYAPMGRARASEAEMRRELRGVKRGVRQRLSRGERAAGAVRLRSVLSASSRRE